MGTETRVSSLTIAGLRDFVRRRREELVPQRRPDVGIDIGFVTEKKNDDNNVLDSIAKTRQIPGCSQLHEISCICKSISADKSQIAIY